MVKITGVERDFIPYLEAHRTADDPLIQELQAETQERFGRRAAMQIALAQGTLLRVLVGACGASRAIEIGTFTGLSALSIARALPEHGRLLACDVSEEWTSVARRYWERASVAHKIDLRIAPALETLDALPTTERFDFAFIDADKPNYPAYYEALLERLRPGGLLAIDNALWGGAVLDPSNGDEDTKVIRELNDRIAADDRVEAVLVAVADGLWLVRRK